MINDYLYQLLLMFHNRRVAGIWIDVFKSLKNYKYGKTLSPSSIQLTLLLQTCCPLLINSCSFLSLSLSLSLYLSLSGSLPLLTLQDSVFSQAHSLLLAVATLSTCCRYLKCRFFEPKKRFPRNFMKGKYRIFCFKTLSAIIA